LKIFLFIKKPPLKKNPLCIFLYIILGARCKSFFLIAQRANEKFYREETGARKKSFRRQAALRSAAGNGPNHDQEKVSRGWQAGDEWAAFRGLARYPGRGCGVEDLDKVAARWDIEDKLTRERLTLASPRFAPQPELIGSRQESEPSDPGGKASDLANRSAPQRSGIE
jgi:hypothetical protein